MDARAALTTDQVARFATALDALAPVGRLGVAVSGGPDSLALLLLAAAVRPGGVSAATVDHGLRAEAGAEAAMVAAVCAALEIPHATLRVTVAMTGVGIQAAARDARYRALAGWSSESGIAALATAHHADDQAETVLLRLARGAGLSGLAGIRQSRALGDGPLRLIRPLLGWRKLELEALVEAAGIAAVADPSNHDPRYDRTRARILLGTGWPDAARVAAAAAHLAESEEALAWSARLLAKERIQFSEAGAEIDAAGVPRELRRRLLLAAFANLAPEQQLRGDSVDRLLAALDGGKAATLAGWRCEPRPIWRLRRAPARRG